ncbi:MAG: 4-hydroxythreonine-4-phosphate dehydrogenase PdxA [Cyclonatronaceae bacterium]
MTTDAEHPSGYRKIRHARNRDHPVVALTIGDMNGIGPEIILKVLPKILETETGRQSGFLLYASEKVLRFYSGPIDQHSSGNNPDDGILPGFLTQLPDTSGLTYRKNLLFPDAKSVIPVPAPGEVVLVPCREEEGHVQPGEITAAAGKLSMDAVAAGVSACLDGLADAIVTAPISKEAIHKAGFSVPGHTEYLAQLTEARTFGMMLVNEAMRIGLVTIHIPLRDVAGQLSVDRVITRLRIYHQALEHDFGIPDPAIAVLGLNPHASDGGVIGNEENEIIIPAVNAAVLDGIRASGPWPADGFFATGGHQRADLVLAMYHDQGLIPLKLAGFGSGVNITAGLPIIRTSPDHGTAFSLAGKNKADDRSMMAAVRTALDMVKRRTTS